MSSKPRIRAVERARFTALLEIINGRSEIVLKQETIRMHATSLMMYHAEKLVEALECMQHNPEKYEPKFTHHGNNS